MCKNDVSFQVRKVTAAKKESVKTSESNANNKSVTAPNVPSICLGKTWGGDDKTNYCNLYFNRKTIR